MQTFTYTIGGRDLVIETGKMAKEASGSAFVRYGKSAVLATACFSGDEQPGLDYVPVTVEYNEKYYAAGRFPGGFLRREARPKDKEILVSRLIDRPMRPLFYKEFGRDIQVIPTVISADPDFPSDVTAMLASFAAVMVSEIPFHGPVASVRIADVDGALVVNPTYEQIKSGSLDIIVAGSPDGIAMVEGGANETAESRMIEAIEKAQEEILGLCTFLADVQKQAGREKFPLAEQPALPSYFESLITEAQEIMRTTLFAPGKINRHRLTAKSIAPLREKILSASDDTEADKKAISAAFEEAERRTLRHSILTENRRCDGRKSDEVRPIVCEVGVLPSAHGSALFTRGETQSLGVTTLGSPSDAQILDDLEGHSKDHFLMHYNFPPYSVGETGRLSTGRREIGHGHLARRALEPMLPTDSQFPYTIRQVSEILESNGSSSQATICSGTLALFDAGVPMKAAVAGIAMGLIKDDEGDNYTILTDILGEEDHMGDMDFKVAGTSEGITAFQMDIKIPGVNGTILEKALAQAKVGRMHILGIMNETLSSPRSAVSPLAPQIIEVQVDREKLGLLIGPGGKTIRGISEKSEARIDIGEDGRVSVSAANLEKAKAAKEMILALTEDPQIGSTYMGKVTRIVDFGAFIEYLPGKEGLCHISQLAEENVKDVSSIVQVGDEVKVKIIDIDKLGRINLSVKGAK